MSVQPFSQLPAVLSRRRAEINALVNAAARQCATAASDYLTAETPVKRGVARSNWVGSVDVPFEGILPAYHPIPDLTSGPAPISRKGETENLTAARLQNREAIKAFDATRNQSIFLRNNAEHIALLDGGRSDQTEEGFFARGVVAAIKSLVGVWRLAP